MPNQVLKQRSTDWRKLRCGVVTASRFADILTAPRTKLAKENGEWSETARGYMLEKLAELLTGIPSDRFRSSPTDWGTEYEAEAFAAAKPLIEEHFGADLEVPEGKFAFIEHPTEPNIGCSPDGIIGSEGLLEAKCPYNPANHIRTLLAGDMPEKHEAQVQGSLWVTGRQFYAFVSFDPRLKGTGARPLFVKRIERDDTYIECELAPRVIAFRDWLMEEYEKLTGAKAPF